MIGRPTTSELTETFRGEKNPQTIMLQKPKANKFHEIDPKRYGTPDSRRVTYRFLQLFRRRLTYFQFRAVQLWSRCSRGVSGPTN